MRTVFASIFAQVARISLTCFMRQILSVRFLSYSNILINLALLWALNLGRLIWRLYFFFFLSALILSKTSLPQSRLYRNTPPCEERSRHRDLARKINFLIVLFMFTTKPADLLIPMKPSQAPIF